MDPFWLFSIALARKALVEALDHPHFEFTFDDLPFYPKSYPAIHTGSACESEIPELFGDSQIWPMVLRLVTDRLQERTSNSFINTVARAFVTNAFFAAIMARTGAYKGRISSPSEMKMVADAFEAYVGSYRKELGPVRLEIWVRRNFEPLVDAVQEKLVSIYASKPRQQAARIKGQSSSRMSYGGRSRRNNGKENRTHNFKSSRRNGQQTGVQPSPPTGLKRHAPRDTVSGPRPADRALALSRADNPFNFLDFLPEVSQAVHMPAIVVLESGSLPFGSQRIRPHAGPSLQTPASAVKKLDFSAFGPAPSSERFASHADQTPTIEVQKLDFSAFGPALASDRLVSHSDQKPTNAVKKLDFSAFGPALSEWFVSHPAQTPTIEVKKPDFSAFGPAPSSERFGSPPDGPSQSMWKPIPFLECIPAVSSTVTALGASHSPDLSLAILPLYPDGLFKL
ncbi:hypothetical protein DFH06DRAFT_1473074 [Mycena polygramma]|nr:hypothetical protein DFH06DRAFT_1473074 [Mycena polygramma]